MDVSGDSNCYLEARPFRLSDALPRSPPARRPIHALTLVDDRIVVRRRPAFPRSPIPPWLLRGIVTTIVIATIGFSLQRLLAPSTAGAESFAAAGRSALIAPGVGEAVPAPQPQTFQPISREAAVAFNNAIPFSTAAVPPAAPFVLAAANEHDRDRATTCLAQAVYYEAGGDTLDDQRAVAQVVLNRLRHPLFPKTVCGVVFQGSQLKTGCQFTFTCDGSMSRVPEARGWARAQVMAVAALNGAVFAPVGYATHFHTPWVAPYWAPTMEKIIQVGGHLFYRWPGGTGEPRTFAGRYAGGEMTGVGESPATETAVATVATASSAPAVVTVEAPVAAPRKIDVAPVIETPAAVPVVTVRSPLVAAPTVLVAAVPAPAARTYHPPTPRSGLAQPLLSRDR